MSRAATKNLVVCCDGTWNRFGSRNTNIVRLCQLLARDPARQILYYDPGVGTLGEGSRLTRLGRRLTRLLGGAIGRGLDLNVAEAYGFLADHYASGDRIFLFGFSRGAYTARAVAGMVRMYGLLGPGNGQLIPYVWSMYARAEPDDDEEGKPAFGVAAQFRRTFTHAVDVHFLGLFDTVSSVGWFWDPLTLPYTRRNAGVLHVRHAVSIDERRAFFRQNLVAAARGQDVKEVWFPGVHCDVGGGYSEDEGGPARVALRWMAREAGGCQLEFDPARLASFEAACERETSTPPRLHESLTWGWWPLEFLPRWRWAATGRRLRWNAGQRRRIDDRSLIHHSALDRKVAGYGPPNLPPNPRIET